MLTSAMALLHVCHVAQSAIGGVTVGAIVIGCVRVSRAHTADLNCILATASAMQLLTTLFSGSTGCGMLSPALDRCEMQSNSTCSTRQ